MPIDVLNARELAAKSHEARRRNKELQALDQQPPQTEQQMAQELHEQPLQARASELDALLARLKEQLRGTIDPLDAMRLCQAIDRLEQSWARYAGVPTPAKGKPARRQTHGPVSPIE